MDAVASPLNAARYAARMDSAAASASLHDLTAALARGDDAAWAEFHRDFGPAIFRYLLGGTRGDYDLAAEALQQAYLRVARYVRASEDRPRFEGWLRTLASSALNDCRRRRQSFWQLLRHAAPLAGDAPPPADQHVFAAVDEALAQLDPADRALLGQKYFSGANVRALAAQMQLTPKAVESRLTRARAALRHQLTTALSRHE